MIPIPKKQKREPCKVDVFRGISLVAVPYKEFSAQANSGRGGRKGSGGRRAGRF